MKELLRSGESPGLLALAGTNAVGWCAVGPRTKYPQYDEKNDAVGVWAIPCVYVAPAGDRSEVGGALIRRAVVLAATNGAKVIEGPPPWWSPGDAGAVSRATAIFLENGFRKIGSGARMPTLQRVLT